MFQADSVLKYFFVATVLHSFARGVYYVDYQRDEGLSSHSSQTNNGNKPELLYGPWTEWTPCSRTCGLGISKRTRSCNKHLASTKYRDEALCNRETISYRACRQQECPSGTPDLRASLCSRYNGRLVAGQHAKVWTPVNGGSNPCELRCQAVEEKLVYGFGKVEDGTPCNDGLCVDGRCLRIGCDDRIGSGTEVDMCGVCGGRNQSCVHYMDVFLGQPADNQTEERGNYHNVAVLPVGARNFEIRKRTGDNVLAMRDRNTAILFHSEENEKHKEHEIAGTVVKYSLEDNNQTEVYRISGPTILKLHVLVLLRSKNYGIRYEYWLPRKSTATTPSYHPHPTRATPPYVRTVRATQPSWTSPKPAWTRPSIITSPTTTYYRSADNTAPRPAVKKSSSTYQKPYLSQTSQPLYGPKRKALLFPQFFPTPQPDAHSQGPSPTLSGSPDEARLAAARNGFMAGLKPIYRTRKPVYNYYEKFRNHTFRSPANVYRRQPDNFFQQTQRDSSDPNGRITQGSTSSEKKPKEVKTEIAYRDTDINFDHRDKKPSSRWEYKFNGKRNVSSLGGEPRLTTAVSISVLPLPEYRNETTFKRKKITAPPKHHSKSRPARGGPCQPCQRVKNQARHFCTSDFVIRASVLGYEFLHGETRYELEVRQSFKNTLSLLPREYVWSPDTCRCPKLRVGKEYVIMGRSDNTFRRNESRLLVDRHCFVRTYSLKHDRRLLRLRKSQGRRCSSKVS